MTLTRQLFNGTDGVDITAAMIGAQQVTGPAAGQNLCQYSTADGVNLTGIRFTCVSTGSTNNIARMPFSASNKQGTFSFDWRTPSVTTTTAVIAEFRNSSARVWQLKWDSGAPGGRLVLIGFSNEQLYVLGSSSVGLPVNTKYRVEGQFNNNSSAAGGTATFNVQIYDMSDTLLYNYTGLPSGDGTAIQYLQIGLALSAAANITEGYDNLQLNDGGTSAIGKYSPNTTAPTVVAGANQAVAVAGTATLTCTPTAYNGDTIQSYSWACTSFPAGSSAPTITNATSQTASVTLPASTTGRWIFSITVTDTSGNVSSGATTRVFVRSSAISPLEVTSNVGWTLSAIGNLSDSNDATYGDSGAAGSNNQLVVRLNPLVPAPTGFSLDVRSLVTATGGTQSVQLLEGATVRKDWGAISPTTSAADTILTLSSAEIATIGSWDELDVRFTQV